MFHFTRYFQFYDLFKQQHNKETIELILVVKDLLHDQGLTIKGANLYLKKNKGVNSSFKADSYKTSAKTNDDIIPGKNLVKDFEFIQSELQKIDKLLE